MMKSPCMKTTLALVLALVLILQALSYHGTEAGRLLHNKAPTTTATSSSQPLKGLHEKQQKPFKNAVNSSMRHIPPTGSNPTQNKYKPPWGQRRRNGTTSKREKRRDQYIPGRRCRI